MPGKRAKAITNNYRYFVVNTCVIPISKKAKEHNI